MTMPLEQEMSSVVYSGVPTTHAPLWAGCLKPFILAHPIGVAVIGGSIVGTAAYYILKRANKHEDKLIKAAYF